MDNAPLPSPDYGGVAAQLAAGAHTLAMELLPHGLRQGQEWVVGGVDGTPGESMKIHLFGAKAGVWSDFATGEAGDALDLVAAVLYRGDLRAAYGWARAWLGLGGTAAPTQRAYMPAPAPSRNDRQGPDFRRAALRLWLEASPTIAGTPASDYLRGRGIDLVRLGRQPRALRFHPACRCTETGGHMPAMVAAVTDAAGTHIATHRTYLGRAGGGWVKASLKEPKKTLGSYRGGTIRLWRGDSGKPLREAPGNEVVVLGEGIETCLSVAVVVPSYRVLCAVSLSNMATVKLPEQIGAILLLADNDTKPGAQRGLARVIDHFTGAGHTVKVARSPFGNDFNDCLRAGT